jgi:hypothetical protein
MTERFLFKYICWQPDRVSQVINTEAVEMDAAVFMATHMPIEDLHYEMRRFEVQDGHEDTLLKILIKQSSEDLHTFAVLKGIPGTGKSHLIRWLYEKFRSERDSQELVLLIRRANSSLKNTLRQILDAGIFDNPMFEAYRQRLESASSRLSRAELSNRILNGLQEAAKAVLEGSYEPPNDQQPSKRLKGDTPDFLLDPKLRQFLGREKGAVDRIADFLSGERRDSGLGEEMPRFDESDFEFSDDLRRELLGSGYESTKRMAKLVNLEGGAKSLADYLNSLLNYGVSNLLSLSVEQLKDMFAALRKDLRRRGRGLTLFIEDITSFTGLDAALIDVLIAQHGQDNPELCRLTSLVGVTDSYYQQNFRDNVRQRISFLISLNAQGEGDASQLLKNEQRVAQMSARYLNAIRLERQAITDWYQQRSSPEVPNACQSCPVREACHAAFGSVQIDDEAVGLYPFNAKALWTMFSNLDSQKTTRTPRSLNTHIIQYVLNSHTDSLRRGKFPPPANRLGLFVIPPGFSSPAQRRLLQAFDTETTERLDALLRVWGDAHIDRYTSEGVTMIGGIPQTVFEAFGLPNQFGDDASPPPPTKTAEPTQAPISAAPAAPSVSAGRYAEDIEGWRAGGQLTNYAYLVELLVKWIEASIDWDLEGVPYELQSERLRQARFEVEGQAGLSRPLLRLTLPRSDDLALVFNALDELRHARPLTAVQIATHTAILNTWLAQNTESIINFVKSLGNTDQLSYSDVVTRDVYTLCLLAGGLVASIDSSVELYKRLVSFAVSKDALDKKAEERSPEWNRLFQAMLRRGPSLREMYMNWLNCPQGTSRSVVFVDAAEGLAALQRLQKAKYRLLPLGIDTRSSAAAESLVVVHNSAAQLLGSVLQAERQSIESLYNSIQSYTGEEVDQLFKMIEEFQQKPGFNIIPLPKDFTAKKLSNRLQEAYRWLSIDPEDIAKLGLSLSGALTTKKELIAYDEYFRQLNDQQSKDAPRLRDELKGAEGAGAASLRSQIDGLIDHMSEVIEGLLLKGGDHAD